VEPIRAIEEAFGDLLRAPRTYLRGQVGN